jgi:hypothetical protein
MCERERANREIIESKSKKRGHTNERKKQTTRYRETGPEFGHCSSVCVGGGYTPCFERTNAHEFVDSTDTSKHSGTEIGAFLVL